MEMTHTYMDFAQEKKHIDVLSLFLRFITSLAALLTAMVVVFLIDYIFIKGVRHLSPELFSLTYTSENCSMLPAMVNTVVMVIITLLISVPLGVGAAIYMTEYARRGSRLVRIVRTAAETLQGVPSIVYGLFGMLFFVTALKWRYSLLAGACTLAMMVLPLIMRTTEEALRSVPDSYREGSFGLGAGQLHTVWHVVLPSAVPGILSGVILAIGRVVGETAALMYTAGSVPGIASSVMKSGRTLAVHMYVLSCEGLHIDQAYATAVMLLMLVLAINLVSTALARRVKR